MLNVFDFFVGMLLTVLTKKNYQYYRSYSNSVLSSRPLYYKIKIIRKDLYHLFWGNYILQYCVFPGSFVCFVSAISSWFDHSANPLNILMANKIMLTGFPILSYTAVNKGVYRSQHTVGGSVCMSVG